MELSKDIIIEKIQRYTSTVFFELSTKEVLAPENYNFIYYDYCFERDAIFSESYKLSSKHNTLITVNSGGPAHTPYITVVGKNKKDVNTTMELIVDLIKCNPIYKDYYF